MRYLLLLIWVTGMAQVHEKLTVVHKDVRVHVLDGGGLPVSGLAREDFVLLENGKVAEIDFFEEITYPLNETAPPGPVEAAPTQNQPSQDRYLVIFLDSSQMRERLFKVALESISSFLDRHASPRTYFKLVHLDGAFKQVTGFTNDPELIRSRFGQCTYRGLLLHSLTRIQRYIDQGIEESRDISRLGNVSGISELPLGTQVVQGTNNSSLLGDRGLQDYTGVNHMIRQKAEIKANHFRVYHFGMMSVVRALEHMSGSKTVFLFTGGSHVEYGSWQNTSNLAKDLGQAFNNADTTVYTLQLTPPNPILASSNNTSLQDPLKLYNTWPPSALNLSLASNTVSENNIQFTSGPRLVAKDTGGFFSMAPGPKKATRKLENLNHVASRYYRLGFTISDPDSPAKIEVALRGKPKNWTVHYGAAYKQRTSYLSLDDEEREIALDAMLRNGNLFRNDLDVGWSHHIFAAPDGGYRIPVIGEFVSRKPPGNGFEFGFIALDEHREPLDQTISVLTSVPRLPRYNYYDLLLTEKLPRFLRTSVRNLDTGDLSFGEIEIDPQKTAVDGGISELMMSGPGAPELTLGINQLRAIYAEAEQTEVPVPERKWWQLKPRHLKQQRLLNEERKAKIEKEAILHLDRQKKDPFRLEERFFKPSPKPYVFQNGVLHFMFHLNSHTVKPWAMQVVVQSSEGYRKLPSKTLVRWQAGDRTAHYQAAVNTSDLKDGAYVLWVRLTHRKTGETRKAHAPFTIESGKE